MYRDFAYFYDSLINDVDYSKWADYFESLFKKYQARPGLILDLCCGTGSLTMELARRGYDMIGIDISSEMLNVAQQKSISEELPVLWVCQDMRDFELYGTVDVILCTMDSLNYLTEPADFRKVIKLVENYLNPNGLFLFDLNSPYKLKNVLGNNLFYEVRDDITYIWQNHFSREEGICTFDLTFFSKHKGDLYQRIDEVHRERAYTIDEIKGYFDRTSLEVLDIFDALSTNAPRPDTERYLFVIKKKPF